MFDWVNKIHVGDCLQLLKQIPDNTVDCCVTSPPYYGLRNYGNEQQIGLEKTPDEYIGKLVSIFAEVKRVLKPQGVMFLNLGDSYSGASCGTYGKVFAGSLNRDYLCESLCGGCRTAYLIGKSRNDNLPVAKQAVSPSLSSHGHKEFGRDHLPTLDSFPQVSRNEAASQDSMRSLAHEGEPPLSSQATKQGESSQQRRDECLRKDGFSACPLCGQTSSSCVRECGHKTACISGTGQNGHPLVRDKLDIFSLHKAYPDYTTMHRNVKLKSKDLIGIPWMAAFALRQDGWYLRQDCIWHKFNPMPESVKDRCTKAHEYIFLLSKSAKYYYDYESILETATGYDGRKATLMKGSKKYKDSGHTMAERGHERWRFKNLQDKGQTVNTIHKIRADGEGEYMSPVRNKRSVWSVPTKPFSGIHFATFPEKLIEPMISAGCPEGGIVLDPFSGAGTTAVVAKKLFRNYIGLELNPEYVELSKKRLDFPLQRGLF